MPPTPVSESTQSTTTKPSSALLACALAGLLGVAAVPACGSEPQRTDDSSSGAGGASSPSSAGGAGSSGSPGAADAGKPADETYDTIVSTTEITPEAFATLCVDRGGFEVTNATCAGSNLCKGLSYMDDGTVLTDHSCKGMNSCAGMSCLDTPKDTGLPGKEIYEAGPCSGCHNGALDGEPAQYIVFMRPDVTSADALSEFEKSSTVRLQTIVAFGTQGVNADGTAFSNMPSFREKYSRAEIERVVDYVRTLPTVAQPFSKGHK